jgi:hypothetical protein
MSEIQRWEVGFSQMNEHSQGEFVTWNDHVAALKEARNELPDVGSWSPEPKFKVGDRVTHRDGSIGVVKFVNLFEHGTSFDVQWHTPLEICGTHPGKNLTFYVPPTPAELIPILKEHEWVRGTYKSGTAFGPYSVYYNEIGAKMAGGNYLIHWNTGKILDELATLERCDAPEVK